MSTLKNRLFGIRQPSLIAFAATMLLGAASALAAPGAIWTSLGTGVQVNGNVYNSKDDVYLNGGPQNQNGQGIPNGRYYFQVTDPSGAVLLSGDPIACREVTVAGGVISGAAGSCPHPNGVPNPANLSIPVKLMPYGDTPNTGGEYKVWLTPKAAYDAGTCTQNFGFCGGDIKTDNFKIRVTGTAYITACKFEDQNGNGARDSGELMIASWPITGQGVDNSPVEGTTDATRGCVDFTVSQFSQSGLASVTITEALLGGFVQRAPADGSFVRSGKTPAYTVTNGVVTSTDVRPGDEFTILFGNQRTGVTDPGRLLVSKDAFTSYKVTWNINKTANPTTFNGASVNPTYTITIGHDSGTVFVATGTINVSNPGSTAVSGVVTDSVDNGGTCAITATSDVTDNGDGSVTVFLSPGQNINVPYTCTYASAPSPMVGTNTVTATWGTNGMDQNFATVDFTNATVVDDVVALNDTLKGALGTLTFPTNPNPTVISYSDVTLRGTPGQCTQHPNTASFQSQTPNSTHSGSSTATVTVCTGLDLTVSKTASAAYKRTYSWNITKDVDRTSANLTGGSATFNYTVVVTQGASTDSDWAVSGNITVSNPNAWTAVNASIADTIPGGTCVVNGGTSTVSVPAATNGVPGTVTVPYTCTFASAPASSVTNSATVTWNATTYGTPGGSASGTAGATFGAPTDTDNKTINVSDTFDSVSGPLSPATLTASDGTPTTATYTYSRTVTGVSGQCVTKNNTAAYASTDTSLTGSASKSVTVCTGADLSVSKTASVSFNRAYSWSIVKNVDQTRANISGESATFNYTVTASQGASVDSGWAASGNITVTNPNQWGGAISVTLTDAVGGTGCVVNGGVNVVSVPQGGSVTVPYACTFSASPGASITNSVTATWNAAAAFTPNGSATNTAGATFGAPAQTTNQSVTVTDTFDGTTTTLGTLTASDTTPASATYTYAHTVAGVAGTCVTKDNTAVVSAGQTVLGQDSERVMVCKGANLTVSKQGSTSFTRTYNWTINKSVVGSSNLVLGGLASYSVTVSQNGLPVDGNYSASGTITVTNPNDWAVTVNVTDSVPGCTVSGGTNVSVPGDGSVTLNYSCTVSSGATFTNTATATWDAAAAITTASSASGSNENSFTTPSRTVNQTVNVSDLFNGSVTTNLGSLTGSPTTPVSQTFTYQNEVPPPDTGCSVINNTATIVETGQSSSAQVTNCNSGAHTIGFWQNKNGQGIIVDSGVAGMCTGLANFLRGYEPFEDLTGSECGTVYTATKGNGLITNNVTGYVYTIIKEASAKGASMNAMLKAQMLATALNVYFSDPARGGNALGSPMPIGGMTIDLTNVRGNNYSAFWGAASKTIGQLLDDAAAASNSTGSHWYGQVKSEQEKAKTTFDAINNEDVFAP